MERKVRSALHDPCAITEDTCKSNFNRIYTRLGENCAARKIGRGSSNPRHRYRSRSSKNNLVVLVVVSLNLFLIEEAAAAIFRGFAVLKSSLQFLESVCRPMRCNSIKLISRGNKTSMIGEARLVRWWPISTHRGRFGQSPKLSIMDYWGRD